jgi:hypothetical protein
VDGRPAVATESDFPPFEMRDRYILFLKPWQGENVFHVLGGPQGTFKSATEVTSIATGQPISRREFLGELRALLKFTE